LVGYCLENEAEEFWGITVMTALFASFYSVQNDKEKEKFRPFRFLKLSTGYLFFECGKIS